MSEGQTGKTSKIWLISAICGVLAFLALISVAGYSTAASLIVAVLVVALVAILLWIGWQGDVPKEDFGHPEAAVSKEGLMATASVGDEPMSAADEIAVEPHAADTREVRSAAAAATAPAEVQEADQEADEPETSQAAVEPAPEMTEEPQVVAAAGPAGLLSAPRNGKTDELRQLAGVGPKVADQLNALGLFHLDQIAALNDADVVWLDAKLKGVSATRISGWVEQAKSLASGEDTTTPDSV